MKFCWHGQKVIIFLGRLSLIYLFIHFLFLVFFFLFYFLERIKFSSYTFTSVSHLFHKMERRSLY